jgi:ATP-dependent Lon protease
MADDAPTPSAFTQPVPVCPVRGSVLFPTMVMPIDAGRPISIRAINTALDRDRTIVIVSQRDRDVEEPNASDLYRVGTACHIMRMKKNPDGSIQMLVRAVSRVTIDSFASESGVIEANVTPLEVPLGDAVLLEAAFRELKGKFGDLVENGWRGLQAEVAQFVQNLEDPGQFADYVAYHLDFKVGDKQAVLEAATIADRLKKALVLLDTELELQETQRRLQREVKEEIDRNQREYFLREQIKALQKELTGSGDEEDEVEAFRSKLSEIGAPEAVMKEANRELNRLARMHPDSAEASVIRTYLTTLTELPWTHRSDDVLDVEHAARILEEDHYGLEKVKDRVLEYLAVRKLKSERAAKGDLDPNEVRKGPILLFAGPPGVGKTSIAKSIAKALGREYVRISLGGARDESDIRGHRRTYIGSMPGRIIQGIRQAGTKNPVFLLDEVDKLGISYQGDPSSALLEVLDPAQNNSFVDHYLGVPFDLSEVLFIATANYVQQIPEALFDRMEPIEFSSYVELEKQEIAKRYLLPRQLPENGLKASQLAITDGAIARVIAAYTREAGVRQLERTIGTLARKVARKIADGEAKRVRLTERSLEAYLGAERFTPESEGESDVVGVATGMYYTPVGGDILFVETSVTRGSHGFVLTGQLGEVMKESARAALTYAKANAERFGIARELLDDSEIHVHVPSGGTPKEGPSAGIALATSLISALTGIPVRRDVAMTGEVTLRGRVLPIGGLREKILGAKRAGIRHVIYPAKNHADMKDIAAPMKKSLSLHEVADLDQVLDLALVGGMAALERLGGGGAPKVRSPKRSKAAPNAAQA